MAFVVSSFFAGVAGGLFAHLLQFINPRVFDIIKSTDILIMVYLGGIGSIGGLHSRGGLFTRCCLEAPAAHGRVADGLHAARCSYC